MAKVSSYYDKESGTVSLRLSNKTEQDRRLLMRIISALADEVNTSIAANDWDVEGVVSAGAYIMQAREDKIREIEEQEDREFFEYVEREENENETV